MFRISKLQISWNGLLVTIASCIAKWIPKQQTREIAYSDLLAEHLRNCLPEDARIEREYRHLGETLDIYVRCSGIFVNDEIVIEVKYNLTKKSELHRLIGQISTLQPGKNKIIIVLIGQCDVELVGRLRQQFSTQIAGSGPLIDSKTICIVEIPESIKLN